MITSSRPKPHRPPSPLNLNFSLSWSSSNFAQPSKIHENRKQLKRLYKVSRQILCAPASQAPVERLFSISGHILSQRRLRTSDKNSENILFANVNFEVLDAELCKQKQPDSDDDDVNEWWNKSIF